VSTSGQHHSYEQQEVFIEDQPVIRGTSNPFVLFNLNDNYEDKSGAATHSITLIQDSLAVMNAFAHLDAKVTLETMNAIFSVATPTFADTELGDKGICEGDTLETVLDALCKLLLGSDPKLREKEGINTGGTWAEDTYRNPFYEELKKIENHITKNGLQGLTVKELGGRTGTVEAAMMTVASVTEAARKDSEEGIAYRYALKELNPFTIIGVDYDQHNQNGELDLYNPDTGKGALTKEWIKVRAEMLMAMEYAGYQNIPYTQVLSGVLANYLYVDANKELVCHIHGAEYATMKTHYIRFGSDKDETLTGGNFEDSLFGGSGDDKLYGLAGANYLEGGIGEDEYHVVSDGRVDTILDVDRRGIVKLDGETLTGGKGAAPDTWKSTDGTITYHLVNNTTLEIIKDDDVQIRILDFVSGRLGIHLETTGLSYADPVNLSPSGYDQVLLAGDARSVKTGTLPDSVTGTGQNDWVELGDGNDNALTAYGRDVVFGGEGNDWMQAAIDLLSANPDAYATKEALLG
jgi:Ca2+-binding RTX toxin-like protein